MKTTFCKLTTLVLALILVLSCFAFVGCNNDPVDPGKDPVDPVGPGEDDPVDPPVDPGDDPVDPGEDDPVDPPVDPGEDDPVDPPVDPGDDPVDPGEDDPVDPPVDPGEDDPVDPGDDPEPVLGEDYLLTLPKANYGKTYTFLTDVDDSWRQKDLYIASEDDAAGNTLDEAIYNRNLRVEEYLGVDFDCVTSKLNWGDWKSGDYPNRIRNTYLAGDQDFQLAEVYCYGFTTLAMEGVCADLRSIDSIDLSAPWYPQAFVEKSTINGQTYGAFSDVSMTMWDNIFCLYFNKDVADRYELVDVLYDMAANEEFTLGFMMECASLHSAENGNDVWDAEDTYGISFNQHTLRTSLIVYGVDLTTYNEDSGEYEVTLYSERTEEIYGTLYNHLWNNNYCFYTGEDGGWTVAVPMFSEGRLLFMPAAFKTSQELRRMAGDFGVLPMPKYDEDQDGYRGEFQDDCNSFIILANAEDPEFCGAVFHALGAESKYSVVPTYYEVILQGRTTRDEESKEMLDIIRDSLHADFGRMHGDIGNGFYTFFGNYLVQGDREAFKPIWDQNAMNYEGGMRKIMDMYWMIR